MSDPTPPDIDVTGVAFDTTHDLALVQLKANTDALGNSLGNLPLGRIPNDFTAEYGNLVDGLLRVLSKRGSRTIRHVYEHGAVLDGVTDDTTAVQAAITAVAALGGGVVFLPVGDPTISSLTSGTNVRLVHACAGTPEANRYAFDGDLAVRMDGVDTLYRKVGTGTTGWEVVIGASAASGGWTEQYVGDFRTVSSDTDLATGTEPTITINGVTWTSNEGAGGSIEQAAVTGFDCTTAAGLVYSGSAVANFSNTNWAAPHVWATWEDLIGTTLGAGQQVCVQAYVSASSFAAANSDIGVGIYNSTTPVDVEINGSHASSKMIKAGMAQTPANNAGALMREGSAEYKGVHTTRLPAGSNCAALIFHSGRIVTGAVGVHDGSDFPEPEDMTKLGTWGTNDAGFYNAEYLDDDERVALFFRNPSSTMSGTIQQVRVLTR